MYIYTAVASGHIWTNVLMFDFIYNYSNISVEMDFPIDETVIDTVSPVNVHLATQLYSMRP